MKNQQIKPGSMWHQNSHPRRRAMVLCTDLNYVRFEAPWSKTGELHKAYDSFIAHYKICTPEYFRQYRRCRC